MAKGREEGIKEGMQKGRQETTFANAINLKQNGVPTDIIAKSLGLTIEEVEAL